MSLQAVSILNLHSGLWAISVLALPAHLVACLVAVEGGERGKGCSLALSAWAWMGYTELLLNSIVQNQLRGLSLVTRDVDMLLTLTLDTSLLFVCLFVSFFLFLNVSKRIQSKLRGNCLMVWTNDISCRLITPAQCAGRCCSQIPAPEMGLWGR